ncbi:YdcF family protein [Reichenbachiella carrageenanivorans]|uniref:YdcF family protein n=1 Tax=Reichenbachiella carrageenanivorans TaxID=2979869 RepID=A0ABY6CWG8_9BACT|nr:YdcF family protein [Reichenbachiella carrageenanivorans]UXX78054.1 YdcF family protein [Reichenbachiella carrageenanivorans]
MFFILSKIIYWLIMPVSLIAWVAIGSLVVKQKKYRQLLHTSAVFLLLFFTNPLLSILIINSWEPEAIPYNQLDGHYRYGVVLSGITNPDRPPFDRVQFNKGSDRIVHAIDLYQKGIIDQIVITGGTAAITFEGHKESHALRGFALSCGIPETDINIEDQARNTRENAIYTADLLKQTQDEILLITSAFHMYRSKKCFKKVGLHVVPFPTDHYGRSLRYTPEELIIPSLNALNVWTTLTKEWVGILAYKLAGYL